MEARIGGGALNLGWKKKKSSISRFVREVRRLNCSVNYGGLGFWCQLTDEVKNFLLECERCQ